MWWWVYVTIRSFTAVGKVTIGRVYSFGDFV
jgi:hypothetical protein